MYRSKTLLKYVNIYKSFSLHVPSLDRILCKTCLWWKMLYVYLKSIIVCFKFVKNCVKSLKKLSVLSYFYPPLRENRGQCLHFLLTLVLLTETYFFLKNQLQTFHSIKNFCAFLLSWRKKISVKWCHHHNSPISRHTFEKQ